MIYAFIISLIFSVSFSNSSKAHTAGFQEPSKKQSGKRLIDTGDGKPRWATVAEMQRLSEKAHQNGKCGGYFDLTDQIQVSKEPLAAVEFFRLNLDQRAMNQKVYLEKALPLLEAQRLSKIVTELSSFQNRYYKNKVGVKAAEWIANQFKEIAKNRNDVTVELFKHNKWAQPSVVAMIAGRGANAKEMVVIGGHEDSINGFGGGGEQMVAPGADDNATGVATVLEVFRVLIESNFTSNRTLVFMTYAGEEAGLLGSQEIANLYKSNQKAVVAVAQFDMTSFPGSGNQVTFMNDFTNPELTKFSQALMDTYVKVNWSNDKCGYACSDHASWHKAGYFAIMPFESKLADDNKDIHTARDLISKLDFKQGLHFAKLGLAFMAELSAP